MNGNKERGKEEGKKGRTQNVGRKEEGGDKNKTKNQCRISRSNHVSPGQGTLTQVRIGGQEGAQSVRGC